jgi:hypothetical protein
MKVYVKNFSEIAASPKIERSPCEKQFLTSKGLMVMYYALNQVWRAFAKASTGLCRIIILTKSLCDEAEMESQYGRVKLPIVTDL